MNINEHLLTIAAEECNEVAQRISKALRFGMEQVQKAHDDQPEQNPRQLTNRQRIREEFIDLVAVLEMIDPSFTSLDYGEGAAKQAKVERYLKLSMAQGTLQE